MNNDYIIRYTFKNDSSGVNIRNEATGLYDAELVNGASIVADANSRIPSIKYLKLNIGTGNYVKFNKFSIENTGLSFVLWVKNNASSFLFNIRDSNTSKQIFIYNNGTHIIINVTGGINISIPLNITDGNWHHLVWTIDNSFPVVYKIYHNGTLLTTLTAGINAGVVYPELGTRLYYNIGCYGDSGDGSYIMNGGVDDFRVYKRVITSEEVGYIYNDNSKYIYNNNHNYQLAYKVTSANILSRALTLLISGGTKVYDGSTAVYNLGFSISGIILQDQISISSYIINYVTPKAGNQIIDISNMNIVGVDYYNYTLLPYDTYIGRIDKKQLLINTNNLSKVYDTVALDTYYSDANGFVNNESYIHLSGELKWTVTNTNIDNINNINKGVVNYVVVGYGLSTTIIYSYDSIKWYNAANNPFGNYCMHITKNNTRWVAVGEGNNSIAYSNNGISWTGIGNHIFSVYGLTIIWTGTMFYAGGQGNNT
jgi:hypothetical protein